MLYEYLTEHFGEGDVEAPRSTASGTSSPRSAGRTRLFPRNWSRGEADRAKEACLERSQVLLVAP